MHQFVWHRDCMKVGSLLIGEEEIGNPELGHDACVQLQRLYIGQGVVSEACVEPCLTEEDRQ